MRQRWAENGGLKGFAAFQAFILTLLVPPAIVITALDLPPMTMARVVAPLLWTCYLLAGLLS